MSEDTVRVMEGATGRYGHVVSKVYINNQKVGELHTYVFDPNLFTTLSFISGGGSVEGNFKTRAEAIEFLKAIRPWLLEGE